MSLLLLLIWNLWTLYFFFFCSLTRSLIYLLTYSIKSTQSKSNQSIYIYSVYQSINQSISRLSFLSDAQPERNLCARAHTTRSEVGEGRAINRLSSVKKSLIRHHFVLSYLLFYCPRKECPIGFLGQFYVRKVTCPRSADGVFISKNAFIDDIQIIKIKIHNYAPNKSCISESI